METHGKRFLNADLSVFVRVFRVFRVREISITEILKEPGKQNSFTTKDTKGHKGKSEKTPVVLVCVLRGKFSCFLPAPWNVRRPGQADSKAQEFRWSGIVFLRHYFLTRV